MMLSMEEKIGRMMMVGFHGLEPPGYLLDWLAAGRVGGVILFARNIASPAQVAALTQACHDAAPRPILIAIDQEGGIVARLREGFSESPGAMALAVAGSEALAEQVSGILAAELRAVGINWNLAPVLDLTYNTKNPVMGVRSLGTDPAQVSALGVAQIRGFQAAGVAATAKHFPGKVDTPIDPHVSLPIIETPVDDLWETDLVPFRGASDAGVASMMISHVQFRSLDPDYPSTLSPRIIQVLLREKMGFEGVVSTDCMEMGAITKAFGAGESAVLAVLAGSSTILFSHTRALQEEAHQAVSDAVQSGRIPEALIDDAAAKIGAMADHYAIVEPPNIEQIGSAEREAITVNAAKQGMVLLSLEDGALPIKVNDPRDVVLIEFGSVLDSEVMERGDKTGFAAMVNARLPNITTMGLNAGRLTPEARTQALQLATRADVLIVATRSAHISEKQREVAQALLDANDTAVLLCLRNPYDAGVLTGSGTILCTNGDSTPSLHAAITVLMGEFLPEGELPVPLTMG